MRYVWIVGVMAFGSILAQTPASPPQISPPSQPQTVEQRVQALEKLALELETLRSERDFWKTSSEQLAKNFTDSLTLIKEVAKWVGIGGGVLLVVFTAAFGWSIYDTKRQLKAFEAATLQSAKQQMTEVAQKTTEAAKVAFHTEYSNQISQIRHETDLLKAMLATERKALTARVKYWQADFEEGRIPIALELLRRYDFESEPKHITDLDASELYDADVLIIDLTKVQDEERKVQLTRHAKNICGANVPLIVYGDNLKEGPNLLGNRANQPLTVLTNTIEAARVAAALKRGEG